MLILEFYASSRSLRISETGDIQGTGGRGLFAQIRVHVRCPGVVALQNVHTSENWLAIILGKTVGTVRTLYNNRHDIIFVLCRGQTLHRQVYIVGLCPLY